jgi:hypothetical protein
MTNTSRRREVAPMRGSDGDRLLREGVDVHDAPPGATRKPDRRGSLSGSPPPTPRLIGDAETPADVDAGEQGGHAATPITNADAGTPVSAWMRRASAREG